MDGLSATGSIISIVAITGQLVESTKALYEFWSSVKEVPLRLHWLSEDTQCLKESFEYIRQQVIQDPNASDIQNTRPALQRCLVHLQNLEALVAPFQCRSQTEEGTRGRSWKSIKAEFNGKKIDLYRMNLEAAKTSLLLTQITGTRSVAE